MGGLVASLALLALAVPLIRNPSGEDSRVTTGGMLQVIWLLRTHPEIQKIVCAVEDPSDKNLRTAGMVEVRLADTRAASGEVP